MKQLFLILLLIPLLYADTIKKISDIKIDTMEFISIDDIQERYDPTKDAAAHLKTKPIQYIEAGFSDTGGNTRTTSLNAKYTFAHQHLFTKKAPMFYTFEASAFLARDNGSRSAEEYNALLSLRQPLPKAWLSYLSVGWLKNDFQNFASKVDLSIGLGKILHKSDTASLIVKLGPATNYEKYSEGGSRSYTSLNEYIEYSRAIRRTGKFYIKLGAKENFSDMQRDYELNSLIGLKYALDKELDFTVEYNLFYDNLPSEGYGKKDSKLIMRLGYRF